MNISTSTAAASLVQDSTPLDNKRAQFQMTLLKRMLDDETNQAAELQKLMDGKGQMLDLRV